MGNNIGPNGFYGFATELRLTMMIDQNHVARVWQFLCYGNWHPARLKWVISFLATWDQWKVVPASERYWVDFNYLQEPRCLPVNMVGLVPCLFIPFRFNLCRPQNYWFRWQLPYSIEISPLRPVSQTPHSTNDQRHCGPIDLPQVWLISRSNRVHQGFVWELCIFNIREGINMND